MRSIILVLLMTIISISCRPQESNNPLTTSSWRSDNKLVTYNDILSVHENIPPAVRKYVDQEAMKFSDTSFETFFFLSHSRYNPTVNIYALKVHYQFSILYIIFAYNKDTESLTKAPIVLNGKWMDDNESGFKHRLMDGSFLEYLDIDSDSIPEVIFSERLHNGTFYNAVQEKYYKLLPDMSFRLLFCNESLAQTFDGQIISRKVRDNRIHVTLENGNDTREIGIIHFNPLSGTLKSKQILLDQFEDMLITSGSTPEDEFFKKGQAFFY